MGFLFDELVETASAIKLVLRFFSVPILLLIEFFFILLCLVIKRDRRGDRVIENYIWYQSESISLKKQEWRRKLLM